LCNSPEASLPLRYASWVPGGALWPSASKRTKSRFGSRTDDLTETRTRAFDSGGNVAATTRDGIGVALRASGGRVGTTEGRFSATGGWVDCAGMVPEVAVAVGGAGIELARVDGGGGGVLERAEGGGGGRERIAPGGGVCELRSPGATDGGGGGGAEVTGLGAGGAVSTCSLRSAVARRRS